jgi:hypothetical protein
MNTFIISAVFGLIGVLLGGGLRMLETHLARRAEAKALLSALVAEVEAVTRLTRHRRYYEIISDLHMKSAQLVTDGKGEEECDTVVASIPDAFFAVYDASLGKIGLLSPYHADRITRFYILARGVAVNYRPDSPLHDAIAREVAATTLSDLELLRTIDALGREIMGFRRATIPQGTASNGLPAQPLPPVENSPEGRQQG